MRVANGRWVCSWCGAEIAARPTKSWSVDFRPGQRGETLRVLVIDGRDAHQCQQPVDGRSLHAPPMWLAS